MSSLSFSVAPGMSSLMFLVAPSMLSLRFRLHHGLSLFQLYMPPLLFKMWYYSCVNTKDRVHVRSGGRAVESRTVNRGVQSHLPPFRNLGYFVHLTLPCLSLCLCQGKKKIPHGGKFVTCSRLTNSREEQLLKPSSTIL